MEKFKLNCTSIKYQETEKKFENKLEFFLENYCENLMHK